MSRQRQTERNREPHGTYGRSWVSHLLPQRSHLVLASRRPDRVQGRPPGHSGGAGGGGSARGLHRRWRGRRRIRARLPTPKRCHAGSNFAKGMTWTKDQRDDMPTPKRCHAGTVDWGGCIIRCPKLDSWDTIQRVGTAAWRPELKVRTTHPRAVGQRALQQVPGHPLDRSLGVGPEGAARQRQVV